MVHIAKLYNADTGKGGKLLEVERHRILRSAKSAIDKGYLKDNETVYPRVENGEIAIYFQPYCTEVFLQGDARHESTGNLLDPWDHVQRGAAQQVKVRADVFFS